MPRTSTSPPGHRDTVRAPRREEGGQCAPGAPGFTWTGHPGHGPGAELLGGPRTALELGCAGGDRAAYLARAGVEVTALDSCADRIARARRRWGGTPGVLFVRAEARDHLTRAVTTYDAVYSALGAVRRTDPEELVPLAARRLTPGGTLALSRPEPADGHRPGAYGPGRWADLLGRGGFIDIDARVLPSPVPGGAGTLLVHARLPGHRTPPAGG
ncbi:methyltransferase domain-containing protein [Streptomyces sp. TRM 70361]|uniref:class I SAM-dependent methyltransferase n=1 Tax=Streptomyces sp. TRM 70361 TaxID=3116553 RepID=UPI002E7B6468|nr:methyltransferase domain-containing protein [Streptomyces sp. TRM 70361]MEE1942280.1 methyltransferase domain-containing protein [Streptomyces sp. TRM 70361]